jgi:hypothetical protein
MRPMHTPTMPIQTNFVVDQVMQFSPEGVVSGTEEGWRA